MTQQEYVEQTSYTAATHIRKAIEELSALKRLVPEVKDILTNLQAASDKLLEVRNKM